jgi:hypothetical protein
MPQFTFEDLLVDIPKRLITAGDPISRIAGFSFVSGVFAVMLSTIDSFLVGVMFAFAYDSWSTSRKILDTKDAERITANHRRITNGARIFALAAIVIGMLLFVFFDQHKQKGGELFINLLLAFYSAQLSFLPLVFGILFLRRSPSAFWANASMIAGAATGIGFGVYSILRNPDYGWYPVLICTSSSTLIYAWGWLLAGPNDSGVTQIARSIADHAKNNKVSLGLFLFFTILAATNMAGISSAPQWRNWEISALLFTLIYTVYIYWENRLCFKSVFGWWAMALGAAPLLLLVIVVILANNQVSRPTLMWLLVTAAAIFVGMDFALYESLQADYPRKSNAFRCSMKFSDIPVFVAFVTLAIYAETLGSKQIRDSHLDAFFAGAIAFQMMVSNLIWTFTDDPLLEEQSTNKRQRT